MERSKSASYAQFVPFLSSSVLIYLRFFYAGLESAVVPAQTLQENDRSFFLTFRFLCRLIRRAKSAMVQELRNVLSDGWRLAGRFTVENSRSAIGAQVFFLLTQYHLKASSHPTDHRIPSHSLHEGYSYPLASVSRPTSMPRRTFPRCPFPAPSPPSTSSS
jgi:hypothetical protein